MTLQERTLYLHRVQYYGMKMMLLQGQWGEQNIWAVFMEWGLARYQLDPLLDHLCHA
jgi:hypothetical protein